MTKWLVLATLTVAAAPAACGETTIDGGRLEADIREDAADEGLAVDGVDCPSPEVKEGHEFECTVTVKGERRPLAVVQREDEAVGYDLTPLLEFTAGSDAGGDEAAVRFVIDAVNRDATALCDYSTARHRAAVARRAGTRTCARALASEPKDVIRDYEVRVERNTATVTGSDSDGRRTVTLRRQRDGSWLIADAE